MSQIRQPTSIQPGMPAARHKYNIFASHCPSSFEKPLGTLAICRVQFHYQLAHCP